MVRALAWKLSVIVPHKLSYFDILRGVLIGEALSSMLPLGIAVSGTAKAISVSNRVPLVVGFSSVATENLFYSLSTCIVILLGAMAFLLGFDLPGAWVWTLYVLIAWIVRHRLGHGHGRPAVALGQRRAQCAVHPRIRPGKTPIFSSQGAGIRRPDLWLLPQLSRPVSSRYFYSRSFFICWGFWKRSMCCTN